MKTTIQEITNKSTWEEFLLKQDLPPFLQSWNTADQYEAMGEKTLKLGIFDESTLVGVCLIIQTRARRGNYLFAPYGPVLTTWKVDYLEALKNYLFEWGSDNNFDFIRIAPFLKKDSTASSLFQKVGFKTAPIHMLAEVLWVLDINKSEDELMMGMRKTQRNLIRRAIKDKVRVVKSTDDQAVDDFIKLHNETKVRHNFVAYPDSLFHEQVKKFKDDNQVIVFRGYDGDQLIASSIIMYYGNNASYHHGASIRSKVPVSYLLQWEAIKESINRNCKEYNFWGIAKEENEKDPFYGITRFKKGFGGEERLLLPCQDYPISKKYLLTYLIESIRRIKRGFGLVRK